MTRFTLIIILVLLNPIAQAAIIHVPGDQPTIQAGIDAAINGDTVLVADGTYSGEGNRNIELRGKRLTVTSVNGPENCIIDFANSGSDFIYGFYCHEGETNLTTIQGFGFFNSSGYLCDAAVLLTDSSPVISNCIFAECLCRGIHTYHSTTQISNCVFLNNYDLQGGAIFLGSSTVDIVSCELSGNIATQGGGIHGSGSIVTITDTIIVNNEATYDSRCAGGGIYSAYSEFSINECTISGNQAHVQGGGIYSDSAIELSNCLIEDNYAQFGGGIFMKGSDLESVIGGSSEKSNTFRNNVSSLGADICAPDLENILNANCNVFSGYIESDYNIYPLEFFDLTGSTSGREPILQNVYVAPGGSDSNDGLSTTTPFKTIRHALSSVYGTEANSVTIHLLPGTYSGDQNGEIFPLPLINHVNIQGDDSMTVIIDGNETNRIFFGYEDNVKLSGLTITGGQLAGYGEYPFYDYGAGIYAVLSSLELESCIIAGNMGREISGFKYQHSGGGIYTCDSNLEMTECIFWGNEASYKGGGVSSTFRNLDTFVFKAIDCQFHENICDSDGGGLYLGLPSDPEDFTGTIEINGCFFISNSANRGGGLYLEGKVFNDEPIQISKCHFSGNYTNSAGGGLATLINTKISRSVFFENESDYIGGAIYHEPHEWFEMINCLLTDNVSEEGTIQGSTQYARFGESSYKILNSTIANNTVTDPKFGAIHLETEEGTRASVVNSILWNNAADQIKRDSGDQGYVIVSYSCVKDGAHGTGNFHFDPGFIGGGDFHLRADSACIDTGSDILFPEIDLDGTARPKARLADVGSYEFPGWPSTIRLYIDMPGHEILSWDPFWCNIDIVNPHAQSMNNLPLFVILVVGDQLFFAPTFNAYDYYQPHIPSGMSQVQVVPEITWPSVGSLDGVLWITALTDPDVSTIESNIATYSFGWHD